MDPTTTDRQWLEGRIHLAAGYTLVSSVICTSLAAVVGGFIILCAAMELMDRAQVGERYAVCPRCWGKTHLRRMFSYDMCKRCGGDGRVRLFEDDEGDLYG